MGVPTSEVGYTSATTRRETTKSMTGMWWYWIKKHFEINMAAVKLELLGEQCTD
jgi:hypothetical protein